MFANDGQDRIFRIVISIADAEITWCFPNHSNSYFPIYHHRFRMDGMCSYKTVGNWLGVGPNMRRNSLKPFVTVGHSGRDQFPSIRMSYGQEPAILTFDRPFTLTTERQSRYL